MGMRCYGFENGAKLLQRAMGANGPFWIIHALFVWTSDDAICYNDRPCAVTLYELQDFVADDEIGPNVLAAGEPSDSKPPDHHPAP